MTRLTPSASPPLSAARLFASLVLLMALSPSARAALPSTIGLEGHLRTAAGGQVADGAYALTFRLYATPGAKSPLWTEKAPAVAVKAGAFQHALGSLTPLGIEALGAARYLSLQVASEPELARRPLHAAPFARLAGVARGVACTGCVSVSALKADGDLNLGGNAVVAKLVSATSLKAGTVTAGTFIGDGSKLTGVGAKAGKCPPGKVVTGILGDGSLLCTSAAGSLPKDGLEQVSNGVLTNDFMASFSSKNTPIPIEDNNPIGVFDTIDLPDIGSVDKVSITLKIANSDISGLKVILYDPNNAKYTLRDQTGSGKLLQGTWPSPNKLVKGDLSVWSGKNPKGKWRLQVIDNKFLSNGKDGALLSWSVGGGGLSDKVVTGKGVLLAKGGLQVQSHSGPPAACTPLWLGRLYIDTLKGGVFICDGTVWRRLLMNNLCGDKVVNFDENCDDGNLIDGDGCTAKCRKNVCGDGVVWPGKEQCDDGNKDDADGCSNACVSKFKAVTFTTCGKSGRFGPTQAQCNAAYAAGNPLSGKVSVSNGLQAWKAPFSGTYRIEAWGAQGGSAPGQPGGLGARMRGDFVLKQGDTLWILVGQRGLSRQSSGGGGGSFVALGGTYAQAKPLLVAGGGGGGRSSSYVGPGRPGVVGTSGTAGKYAGGTGGNGGKRSGSSVGGFAGGGYYTDGQQGPNSGSSGLAFIHGGTGGKRQDNGANLCEDGGFGGGGGGMHNQNQGSGGGGGYSGGGAGHDSGGGPGYGGGGGSFNSGANPSNAQGVNAGHGKVVISLP